MFTFSFYRESWMPRGAAGGRRWSSHGRAASLGGVISGRPEGMRFVPGAAGGIVGVADGACAGGGGGIGAAVSGGGTRVRGGEGASLLLVENLAVWIDLSPMAGEYELMFLALLNGDRLGVEGEGVKAQSIEQGLGLCDW
jgi:hypothetical protein